MTRKPDPAELRKEYPDADPGLVDEYLERLDNEYFDFFSFPDFTNHLKGLESVRGGSPWHLEVAAEGETAFVTIISRDHPALFSLLVGILSSSGLDISSGKVFTYQRKTSDRKEARRILRTRGRKRKGPDHGRYIIDYFQGTFAGGRTEYLDRALRERMEQVFHALEGEGLQKAKEIVNELVVARLSEIDQDHDISYPVKVDFHNDGGPLTEIRVQSEDTPFFLYTLSTALTFQDLSIEHVDIRTIRNQVVDNFFVHDGGYRPIENEETLKRLRLSILFTKQFTFYLGTAPDTYAALSRFEYMLQELSRIREDHDLMELFSTPGAMKRLAQLLGTSDYVWEEFIRTQYESILPVIEDDRPFRSGWESIDERLREELGRVDGLEEKRKVLNDFKDRENFMIDLEHILNNEVGFRELSGRLTYLAENVVRAALDFNMEHLERIYGPPRSVAGLDVSFAVMGLGKMGGAALGYASDIELLFVYSDSGTTEGEKAISNAHFFELLVQEIMASIRSKQEGIFELDLRLRPFGSDGPLAASLDSFVRYYGPGGSAHSYERLALTRMRFLAGERDLGERLERLRNEYIYTSPTIDFSGIQELREKQFQEKRIAGRVNAKYSPGCLVDIEYTVQLLQVRYAQDYAGLMTPRIHEALDVMAERGIIEEERNRMIQAAYDFFRRLINGLRMLRGSARDLFLPETGSLEYDHLARRMGYRTWGDLSTGNQLYIELETHSAVVRSFIEERFGRDSLPGPDPGNVADIVLSPALDRDVARSILERYGFADPEGAADNLRRLAGEDSQGKLFAGLAVLAVDMLARSADPDMALNNWERYVRSGIDRVDHYRSMLSQPKKLQVMIDIFAASQFLSDALVTGSGFLEWVVDPANLYKELRKVDLEEELWLESDDDREWMDHMRRVKKRELLRIGTRDICLRVDLESVVKDLSILAGAVLSVAAERCVRFPLLAEDVPSSLVRSRYVICAFGKLGGEELNYSSDIDLLMVMDSSGLEEQEAAGLLSFYTGMMERITRLLSEATTGGYAYRVDLRLRPYGTAGPLVQSVSSLVHYFREKAAPWEVQALLKLGPVAGKAVLAYRFLEEVKDTMTSLDSREVRESIHRLREASIREKEKGLARGFDVKNGRGGIRDIEFLVQGLQLARAGEHPDLVTGNTLQALAILEATGVLPSREVEELRDDYRFLRRVEHFLQLFEDRQTHTLPGDGASLTALARRVYGTGREPAGFMEEIDSRRERVRRYYRRYIMDERDEG